LGVGLGVGLGLVRRRGEGVAIRGLLGKTAEADVDHLHELLQPFDA
jgi:hypothetical protein